MFTSAKLHTDEWLVRQCLERDPDAWRELDALYQRPLVAYVARRLKAADRPDWQAAEEIVAEVVVSLLVPDDCRLRAYDPGRATL